MQLHLERALRRGSEGLRGRRLGPRPHAGDVALVRGHHARAARGGAFEQRHGHGVHRHRLLRNVPVAVRHRHLEYDRVVPAVRGVRGRARVRERGAVQLERRAVAPARERPFPVGLRACEGLAFHLHGHLRALGVRAGREAQGARERGLAVGNRRLRGVQRAQHRRVVKRVHRDLAGRRAARGRNGHVERVRAHGLPAPRVAFAGAVGRVARGVHGRGQGIGVVHGPVRIHARHRQRAVRAAGHGHRGVRRHFNAVVVQLAVFHLQFGAADAHRGVRAVQLHVERALRRGSEGLRGRRLVLRALAGDVAFVRGHRARAARGGVVEQRAFGHYHFFNDSLLFLHASVAVSL